MGFLVLEHKMHFPIRGGARLKNPIKRLCFDVVLKKIKYENVKKLTELEVICNGDVLRSHTLSTADKPLELIEGVTISLKEGKIHNESVRLCYDASSDWKIYRSNYDIKGKFSNYEYFR